MSSGASDVLKILFSKLLLFAAKLVCHSPPFVPLFSGEPLIVWVVMFGCTSWGERSCVALAWLTCASE